MGNNSVAALMNTIGELREQVADLEKRNLYLSQQNDMLRCRVSYLELQLGALENERLDDPVDDDVVVVRPVFPMPPKSQ